jgi:pyrroline-5-carboxylate reductase
LIVFLVIEKLRRDCVVNNLNSSIVKRVVYEDLNMHKLGFLGSGKMAQAMIKCFGTSFTITSSDKNKEKLESIKQELSINTTLDNKEVLDNSDIVFICVKPQDMESILLEIKDHVKEDHLIISIVAGIFLDYIQKFLPEKRIMRVMPNILCTVKTMSAAFSKGKYATEEDLTTVQKLLNLCGVSFLVDEKYLDAVTAISGSSPAFIAYIANLLVKEGQSQGLQENVSRSLVIQTILGTAKMISEKNLEPEKLIEMVASPGGTTFAGLKVLNESDIDKIMKKTIQSTVNRAKGLSK